MHNFLSITKPAFVVPPTSATQSSAEGAEAYPNRPIRFIVPFAEGGPADLTVRILAEKLTESWAQPVIIDNKDGVNGIVGSDVAAKAAPDGYTIAFVNSTYFINPSVYRNLPFDPIKDFTPISLFSNSPVVLVANRSIPVNSVDELIAYVKAHPGRLKYTSGGAYGSPSHVAGELFNMMAGIKIPYVASGKGHGAAGAALSDGRDVQLMFDAVLSAMPHIRNGEWRALASTTAQRAKAMPDLPTIAESGVPGYEVSSSQGIVAPAGTPPPIVDKLSREIARIVQSADVKERFFKDGKETTGTTPQAFATYIKTEMEKWAKVVKSAGIKVKDYAN